MYPILTKLGPVTIYSFGTFIVIGFLVASWYVRRRSIRELGVDGERVFNFCFVLLFLALFGARLLYVLLHYDEHVQKPMSAFMIWNGGLAFYGGLAMCLIAIGWYLPRHKELGGWSLVDVLVLGGCLAIFVGRWASFLSGENYGDKSPDLAWGVRFPPGAESQIPRTWRGIPLHPTQLYHSLHGLVLFVLLLLYLRRKPAPGRALGLFLMLYAIGRGIIEIWRADDVARGMVIPDYLSIPQLLCIPTFFLGLGIFLTRHHKDEGDPAASTA